MGEPATGIRFEVKIDGVDIGSFTGCSGLGAEYEIFEYQEGGQNDFVHRLPGRMKYSPVTLIRPVDEKSGELAAWFSSFRESVKTVTGSITAFDPQRNQIAQWNLGWPLPLPLDRPDLLVRRQHRRQGDPRARPQRVPAMKRAERS